MTREKQGRDTTIAGSKWAVRYHYLDRIECRLYQRHPNGDADTTASALGIGDTEAEALREAAEDLCANLARKV